MAMRHQLPFNAALDSLTRQVQPFHPRTPNLCWVHRGLPPDGGAIPEETIPNSINEKGEIAGYFMATGSSAPIGFVRAVAGTITTFNVIGFPFGTVALSINAAGAITGNFTFPSSPPNPRGLLPHGFVRDPEGNFTTFDPSGSI